jgi:diguanylate cyclase (GGDEF)-like protein
VEREEISPLRRSADVDELTGLSSRSFFERAAGRRVEQARDDGAPLACILLDVDDFKAYNDSHGHGAGDEILRCVARILRESARADDLVGRYEGEEFVLLVNGEVGGAREVAERIRKAVQQVCVPEPGNSLERPTTVSLGVVPLSDETKSLDRLIAMADAEIYRSKKTGENRVSVSESPWAMHERPKEPPQNPVPRGTLPRANPQPTPEPVSGSPTIHARSRICFTRHFTLILEFLAL